MFGVLAAGRLVDTSPVQVSETEFLFQLESPESVNHLVRSTLFFITQAISCSYPCVCVCVYVFARVYVCMRARACVCADTCQ
jgi:hypothetical protein